MCEMVCITRVWKRRKKMQPKYEMGNVSWMKTADCGVNLSTCEKTTVLIHIQIPVFHCGLPARICTRFRLCSRCFQRYSTAVCCTFFKEYAAFWMPLNVNLIVNSTATEILPSILRVCSTVNQQRCAINLFDSMEFVQLLLLKSCWFLCHQVCSGRLNSNFPFVTFSDVHSAHFPCVSVSSYDMQHIWNRPMTRNDVVDLDMFLYFVVLCLYLQLSRLWLFFPIAFIYVCSNCCLFMSYVLFALIVCSTFCFFFHVPNTYILSVCSLHTDFILCLRGTRA